MLKENEVDPKSLERGDIVQFENKYHLACIVKVLDVQVVDQTFKAEVKTLDTIFGNPDDRFTVSYTLKDEFSHYVKSKFKEVGSMTEYVNTGEYQDHVDKMKLIREKYD